NDVGYNRQANLHRALVEVGWRVTKPTSIVLEGNVFAGIVVRASWNGDALLQKAAYLNTWLRFRNFWTTYFEIDYDLDHDDNREARVGSIDDRSCCWTLSRQGLCDQRSLVVI